MNSLMMLARFGHGGAAFGFLLVIALVAVAVMALNHPPTSDKK